MLEIGEWSRATTKIKLEKNKEQAQKKISLRPRVKTEIKYFTVLGKLQLLSNNIKEQLYSLYN